MRSESRPGPLRIAVLLEPPFGLPLEPECAAAVDTAVALLESLGHSILEVKVEIPDEVFGDFLNIVNSGLADYHDVDWSRVEPHVAANRQTALAIDSLTYVSSVHALQRYTRTVIGRWGGEFDVLITPTMTILPPRAGEVLAMVHADPGTVALPVLQMAIFNGMFNMSGQPAVSLPLHMSSTGLPVGVQFVGGPWQGSAAAPPRFADRESGTLAGSPAAASSPQARSRIVGEHQPGHHSVRSNASAMVERPVTQDVSSLISVASMAYRATRAASGSTPAISASIT